LANGLKQGDRIGIMSLNSAPMVAAYLGIMRAGMVAVPISFKLPRETIDYIVKDAELRAVFHDHERATLVPGDLLGIDFDTAEDYPALLDYRPFTAFEPEDRTIAMILYTSGSTGRPKGVLLSHRSQMWALEAAARAGDRSQHRYIVEPQSAQYLTHGDLWDHLYLRALGEPQRTFVPLTLEMGSWLWVKKNPRQLFSRHGIFNPLIEHRQQRVLRTHVGWLDFMARAACSHRRWVPLDDAARETLREEALRHWYATALTSP
jgi:acyl-CoA synthetase (AMP-forming)/AMP-acid ligase II